MSTASTRKFSIPPSHELRFELESPTDAISVKLLSGFAEVFGFELMRGATYGFANEQRGAVWAPGVNGEGAELEMSLLSSLPLNSGGATRGLSYLMRNHSSRGFSDTIFSLVFCHSLGALDSVYVASESTMPTYLNLHLSLSRLRHLSRPSSFSVTRDLSQPDDEVAPPRVLVIGERGAGKSSLIKMLTNWRNREARATLAKPGQQTAGLTVVNLDPNDGSWTLPGTVGVVSTSSLLPTTTPIAPFGTSFSSGPPVPFPTPSTSQTPYVPPVNIDAYAPVLNPLVYFYGHLAATTNEPHYELLTKSVASAVKRTVDAGGIDGWKSGYLIDTPGEWAEKKGGGWEKVKAAVREFEVNVLLVFGSERLYVEMTKLLNTNKTVTVVRVPKSDGASDLDLSTLSRIQSSQIRSYFYGGPALTQGVLSPFSIIVKFDDVRICRVGEAAGAHAPSSALPLGATRLTRDTELVPIDLAGPRAASEILNRILAVPQAEEGDEGEEKVVKGPVGGFVWVSALDQAKKKITLLSPLPGRLPRKTLILGSLDWVDS
ncbi:cleavage polyadenylation factor subunit CLP1 [Sporobolomyces salmoneus]|uniref:cleavage polyadenylation factor subunit CLP1 n=1 Tax=Sporobolomyces salmoneus TaxID=183962 RepID=UPI003176C2F6